MYFLTLSGFFIGLAFSITANFRPENILFITMLMTTVFYIIALAACSFFIKFIDTKGDYASKHGQIERTLDKFVKALEKREQNLRDSVEFLDNLEKDLSHSKKGEEFIV